MKKYESMLTTVGKAKLMAAQAKGEHVQLTTFAVGSGIQATVETQKALQKEEWRGAITNIAVDSKDKNVLDVETVIPANEGGFHIREFGVFDEVGDLIIVGNTPESYKPLLDAGAASSMRIISKTIISNAANVTLLMDENALYVTHEYLTQQLNLHTGDNDNPHGVTKSQVGLGKVQDYELATEADAESGTSHQKYMTPLRTKQAITKQLDSHANDYVAHPGYANTTGTNAYSVTLNPKPTALVAGLGVVIKVGNNATANCTLNVNGLGAKPIVDSGGKQVKNLKADSIYSLRYGGTSFILQGEGGEYGTATATDVRSTKTFGTEDGVIQGSLDLSKLIASNIRSGVTIDGVIGQLVELTNEKKWASGKNVSLSSIASLQYVAQYANWQSSISQYAYHNTYNLIFTLPLGFTPSTVIIYRSNDTSTFDIFSTDITWVYHEHAPRAYALKPVAGVTGSNFIRDPIVTRAYNRITVSGANSGAFNQGGYFYSLAAPNTSGTTTSNATIADEVVTWIAFE